MIYTFFKTKELENKFRKLILKRPNEEIGGFLLYEHWAYQYLGFKNHKQFYKYFNTDNARCNAIVGWILVPNESQSKQNQYLMSNLNQMKEVAKQTSLSYSSRTDSIHFHSHPKGSDNTLSQRDISFALDHCTIMKNAWELAIVTSYPLQVSIIELRRPWSKERGDKVSIQYGEFLPWNSKRMKALIP